MGSDTFYHNGHWNIYNMETTECWRVFKEMIIVNFESAPHIYLALEQALFYNKLFFFEILSLQWRVLCNVFFWSVGLTWPQGCTLDLDLIYR